MKNKIKKQIPNIITWSRLALLIPTFASFLSGNALLATGIFTVAAATDFVDGRIARKLNVSSEFGAKLDAVCDKFYVAAGSAMPIITSGPIFAAPLVLEAVISAYNIYRNYVKKQHVKSTMTGKVKTCVLFATLILGTVAPSLGISQDIVNSALAVTTLAQGATLASYIKDSSRENKTKEISEYIEKENSNIEETEEEQSKEKSLVNEQEEIKQKYNTYNYEQTQEETKPMVRVRK